MSSVFVMGMVLPTGHLNAPLEPGARLLFILLLHSLLSLSLYIYLMDMHSIPSTQLKFLSCHLYLFSLPRNRFLAALLSAIHTHTTSPLFSSWIQMWLMLCCLLLPAFLSTLTNFRSTLLYSLTILDQKYFITLILTALSFFFSPKKRKRAA